MTSTTDRVLGLVALRQARRRAFNERLSHEINSALSILNLWLGLKLGLFRELRAAGRADAQELAARVGCQERYVREWLECIV